MARAIPTSLEGEQIPLGARIIGAAEIFDALTTSRPYQEKMAPDFAVERMRDLAGTVIDPEVVYRALEVVVRATDADLPGRPARLTRHSRWWRDSCTSPIAGPSPMTGGGPAHLTL